MVRQTVAAFRDELEKIALNLVPIGEAAKGVNRVMQRLPLQTRIGNRLKAHVGPGDWTGASWHRGRMGISRDAAEAVAAGRPMPFDTGLLDPTGIQRALQNAQAYNT